MGINLPGFGIVLSVAALLVILVIVVTGHCSFNGSVGLGLH